MTTTVKYYLVGVYGTLKRAFPNHKRYMVENHAEFQGYGNIQGTMIDLGSFPGVVASEKYGPVQVEVYKVSDLGLMQLDFLEGNGHFYTRGVFPMQVTMAPLEGKKSNLPLEDVWVYCLPDHYLHKSCSVVVNSFWEGPGVGPRMKVRNKVADIRASMSTEEIPMNANDKKITEDTTMFKDSEARILPALPPPKPAPVEEVWVFPQTVSFDSYMAKHKGINHAKTA